MFVIKIIVMIYKKRYFGVVKGEFNEID